MEIDGPDGVFYLMSNYDGYWAAAAGQKVGVTGSPVVISFDPPIAPTVDLGAIYQAIKAKLPGGILP